MSKIAALHRTLLLMRDDLRADVSDEALLEALTSTHVVLVADRQNLDSHSAQTAFVSAALLMERCGLTVQIEAPDIAFRGVQAPLRGDRLIDALLEIGGDLVPDTPFISGRAIANPDLVAVLGDTCWPDASSPVIGLHAGPSSGSIVSGGAGDRWLPTDWPLGGLAAAGLISIEAFKAAMRKVRSFARDVTIFDELYAPICSAVVNLHAEPVAPFIDLGSIDFISAGAIVQSALFALGRIPGVHGDGRILDDDVNDLTNINRNAFLRRSRLGVAKADDMAVQALAGLRTTAVRSRFDAAAAAKLSLAPTVLVGVDHIPTRWEVQRAKPRWLGVGATSHFMAMASFHEPDIGCAGCLHPVDDDNDSPIPTLSIVSHWAGLFLADLCLARSVGAVVPLERQSLFFFPLRSQSREAPVPKRADCPVCS